MQQKISDEELLDSLRAFYKAHGRAPAMRDFPGGPTYEYRFGSWNAALRAAGLPINKPGFVSNEEMIAALQNFYHKCGRSPTLDEFPKAGTIEQRFGSWNKALESAGLPPNKKNQISDQDLLDRLRAFFHRHGHSPTYVELPGATTILTRFGGWNNALSRQTTAECPQVSSHEKPSAREYDPRYGACVIRALSWWSTQAMSSMRLQQIGNDLSHQARRRV
jgi:hypothetical protein